MKGSKINNTLIRLKAQRSMNSKQKNKLSQNNKKLKNKRRNNNKRLSINKKISKILIIKMLKRILKKTNNKSSKKKRTF